MMNTSDNGSTLHLPGITSWGFHITQWILVSFGVVGNLLVIVWRCTWQTKRKFHLHSLLIISLAFSDLLYCIQALLREAMLVRPIFGGSGNHTFPYTEQDSRLCQTAMFLTFSSCNAIVVTSLSIALHTFFFLRNGRRVKIVVVSVMAAGWFLSLTVAAFAVYFLKKTEYRFYSLEPSPELFSLIVVFGCNGFLYGKIIPVIVTIVNAVSSMACCFLYARFCFKIRRIRKFSDCGDDRGSLGYLQIRLIVIVVLNLVCWWPACILYCYSYFSKASVFNGRLDPKIPEPALLLVSAVSTANPLIYTISSDAFLLLVKRLLHVVCDGHSETGTELMVPLVSGQRKKRTLCCRFCWCKLRSERRIYDEANELSEITVETTAFDST